MGYGHRTSQRAVPFLEKITEREVVPLKLSQEKVGGKFAYHFDITTIILEEQKRFILYPRFLTDQALRKLEKLGEIHVAHLDDALALALNAVVVPGQVTLGFAPFAGDVITSSHASSHLVSMLIEFGYCPHFVDLSEFLKSGGGALCLTKILEP